MASLVERMEKPKIRQTRRMHVRQRRMRHPRSIVVQVERSRNELAQLIPKKELQIGQVDSHLQRHERQKKNEGGCPFGGHLVRYWITDPAACGSSLISPNADSYCCTFWFSTFASALACWGLRKMPS